MEKERYKIRVYPNYSEQKIERKDDTLHVYVRERAESNKANIAVIKLLSKYFRVNAGNIRLKGLSSKNKFIEINYGK